VPTPAQELGLTAAEAGAIAGCAADLAEGGDLRGAQRLLEGLTFLNPLDAAAWSALAEVYGRLALRAEAERAQTRGAAAGRAGVSSRGGEGRGGLPPRTGPR
jgi:predicted Zn-dependent protease